MKAPESGAFSLWPGAGSNRRPTAFQAVARTRLSYLAATPAPAVVGRRRTSDSGAYLTIRSRRPRRNVARQARRPPDEPRSERQPVVPARRLEPGRQTIPRRAGRSRPPPCPSGSAPQSGGPGPRRASPGDRALEALGEVAGRAGEIDGRARVARSGGDQGNLVGARPARRSEPVDESRGQQRMRASRSATRTSRRPDVTVGMSCVTW